MASPQLPVPPKETSNDVADFGLRHDRFELVSQLSNGGQGEVHVCSRVNNGECFAVKIIIRHMLQKCRRNEVLLRREIRTLRELHHPNVVSLHDAFWEGGSCFIVMDLAREGDLKQKVKAHKGLGDDPMSSEHASKYVVHQLVAGITYMHRRRVIHRDLKAENILVAYSRPAAAPLRCRLHDVKITDFGLSTWLDIVGEEMTPCGTPNYLAPEIMTDRYDERVDFWSMGVVLYMLLCGGFPFKAYKHPTEVQALRGQSIKSTPSWESVSEMAKAFVRGLLAFDPNERLAHGETLRHPWLASETPPEFSLGAEAAALPNPQNAPGPGELAGAVARIAGWMGSAVDCMDIQGRDGATQHFGSKGGWTHTEYSLQPDEVIVAVAQETRSSSTELLGNALVFYTSLCQVIALVGADARRRRRFVAPIGCQIVGLQFCTDRLAGILIEDIANGDPGRRVQHICGRTGYAVDRVILQRRDGTSCDCGGDGGFQQGPWELEFDEFIVVVEQGRRDEYLGTSIAFYTTAGRVYKLSGVEASYSRRFSVTSGRQVCGLEIQDGLLCGVRTCPRGSSCPRPDELQYHLVT